MIFDKIEEKISELTAMRCLIYFCIDFVLGVIFLSIFHSITGTIHPAILILFAFSLGFLAIVGIVKLENDTSPRNRYGRMF